MKIVCISDTHGMHNRIEIPDGEMLIHAGDITGDGSKEETRDFIQWFASLPHKYKVFVSGNHDRSLEKRGINYFQLPDDVQYLENSSVNLGGLKIWGSPYVPLFGRWSFMKEDLDLYEFWHQIPEDTDILVTHGPAWGINDKAYPTQAHLGSKTLAEKLTIRCPQLHLHGHIHGGYGITEANGIIHVNAAQLDEAYKPSNKPIVIDITPRPKTPLGEPEIDQSM